MTTYDVYSKRGADNRFAPKSDVDALTSAQIAQGAEIAAVKEQIRAQLLLSNMLPRQGGPGVPTALVVGFIGDSWMTPGAGGQGGAPEEATMVQIAAKRLGVGAAVSGQGSTGWAHVPTPTPAGVGFFSAPARVDAVLDAHPSLLVVVGSVNDNWAIDQPPVPSDPASGPRAISQSVKALVTRVRDRAPALPIIVVGPQPTSEYRTYAGSSHKNVHAVKDGVDLAGGLTNGIWFTDWLGVATSPATRWDPATSPNRHWGRGEVICYDGVNYEVTEASWVPSVNPDAADPYLASFLPSAPVSRRTAVLSGRGAVGRTPASGTRALWLMGDETHVNVAGAQAFGVELADRVIEGVQALREWIISKGPVVVRPAPAPGPQPARPMGAMADVRDARWGVRWGALSASALQAALAQLPEGQAVRGSAALPVRMSKDEGADRFVTSTVSSITPKGGGAAVRINQSTIAQLKAVEDVNGTVATLGEALDILDAAPARTPIVVECMDTSNDIIADYWVYDQKMMQYLLARYGAQAAKRVIVATNGTLNAARQKAKADAALRVLPRLAYKPSGPWTAEDVGALKAVDMIACRPNDTSKPEVLAAIKNHPEGPGLWWAGMTTAAHVDAARAASKAAGLAIEGWLMEAKEAAPGALSTALPVRP